jgi:3-hydroxyisobutyrate dehydrogenase-like beta-hydroxyacid dehydrogenase
MKRNVSVIGLGTMGSTLARLLLRDGYPVTIWNRSPAKAEPLRSNGAAVAPSPAAAIAASHIVVVCVYDYTAATAIFDKPDVRTALADRVLVQLTTGSPQEARDGEQWARRHGARYIDGAIQAAPSQMGRPDTTILVSGAADAYRQAETVLKVFGGNVRYLGEQIAAASTMDLATLSYVYGAIAGFFHGARVAETEGLGVDLYGALVAEISPTFGEFFRHEGQVVQSGNYEVSESPLRISVEATKRLVNAARSAGINAEFPIFVSRLLERAMIAGYGDQEVAALVKVLREGVGDELAEPVVG